MWDPSTLKTNEIHAVLISWYKVLTATRDTHTHTHTYIYIKLVTCLEVS